MTVPCNSCTQQIAAASLKWPLSSKALTKAGDGGAALAINRAIALRACPHPELTGRNINYQPSLEGDARRPPTQRRLKTPNPPSQPS
jgi:hypothetical protein